MFCFCCCLLMLQAAYVALCLKRRHREKDTAFEDRVKESCLLLPDNHLYPSSLYVMKKLLSCRSLDEVQVHVCVDECCSFDHLPRKEYKRHVDDKCLKCGQLRFEFKQTSSGRRIVPRKFYYDLGVESIIRDQLFTDVSWCAHRGQGRATPEDYYTSTEAERLHAAANVTLQDLDTSVYELGLDWGNMYSSTVHSTGYLSLR
jgi:hypothetical protein